MFEGKVAPLANITRGTPPRHEVLADAPVGRSPAEILPGSPFYLPSNSTPPGLSLRALRIIHEIALSTPAPHLEAVHRCSSGKGRGDI